MASPVASIPVVDIQSLATGQGDVAIAVSEIQRACRDNGFFYVRNHGISQPLQQRLEQLAHRFFAQDLQTKLHIRMQLGGRAWRGFFPVGDELTSGKPDHKEGIYFGTEHPENHPKVLANVPLHGRNLFPDLPGFRETVLSYLDQMTELGHAIMRGIALSLGLDASYFHDRYTSEPTILFRIFHYPPLPPDASADVWGVGEHTDYGLLTILRQDEIGGLQVKSLRDEWIDAPPIPGTFICNIGDMLDRLTGGLYRSTPHRVRNRTNRERYSFPFFFDPQWDARVEPIYVDQNVMAEPHQRWDGARLHEFRGTYGQYLLDKVAKVFPELGRGPS